MALNWDHPLVKDADENQKWDFVRVHRNKLLAESDWTQLPDAPVDKQAWAEYRQALRDLPTQSGNSEEVVFPTRP